MAPKTMTAEIKPNNFFENGILSHTLEPFCKEHWLGRTEPKGQRFFQVVQPLQSKTTSNEQKLTADHEHSLEGGVVLLGFSCDEGVKRNLGRPGAAHGPSSFRTQLAKLPYRIQTSFFDAGNILIADGNMERAQSELGHCVEKILAHPYFSLVIGGGHEVAFGHYLGIKAHCRTGKKRLGIINFDAHFDLRELQRIESTQENSEEVKVNWQGNSGTPFTQIATDCAEHDEEFKYLCLGIQPHSNHDGLYESAAHLGVKYIEAQKLQDPSLRPEIMHMIQNFCTQVDAVYLTICLDVFNQAIAPGVSAPQSLGLFPQDLLPFANAIMATRKVIALDFAELNPIYDSAPAHSNLPPHSGCTAQLAASIAATLLEIQFQPHAP